VTRRCDVAIVGGGVIGAAIAERASAARLTVTVIDDRGEGGLTSRVSGGLIRGLGLSGTDEAWAVESLGVYTRRGWRGRWPAVRRQGSLSLVEKPKAERLVQKLLRVAGPDYPVSTMSERDVERTFPGLSVASGCIGVLEPEAGWIPAEGMSSAMLGDADSATLLAPVRALEIVTRGSEVAGVRTTAGLISAPVVVLACGLGARRLAASVGVELPLRTRAIGYCIFRERPGRTVSLPTIVDQARRVWVRGCDGPQRDLLVGAVSNVGDVPTRSSTTVSKQEIEGVRKAARPLYEPFASASFVRGVSAFDTLFDPAMERVRSWPVPSGLITAVGWNGGGFKTAPTVGRLVAELARKTVGQ
jgi:glycine/D-amino acid oxidase-like deaminating enzyme